MALLATSAPISVPALSDLRHQNMINDAAYKKQYGHWDIIDTPPELKLNTIHAALLPTGKVLLVAGSGNNRTSFNSFHDTGTISVLKTAVYDPTTNHLKLVPTPADLFCSGHAILQSGNVLVAGGTSGYELQAQDVKKPAGGMAIHNENPDAAVRIFRKGTRFVAPNGNVYISTQDVTVGPAMKMVDDLGQVMIHHSSATVFVEAAEPKASYVLPASQHFTIAGLQGDDTHNIYGQGGAMTLNKQDFRGDNQSYEFDPITETYVKSGDLNQSRWYPSLPVLDNGRVLAVSGLDNIGTITNTTEQYDPATKQWTPGPSKDFPTYPALFRTKNPDVLFFSGSNAGYGPADKGREPGFWNYKTNSFDSVSGLRDTNILETSGSVSLPPSKGSNDGSQSEKIMLAGGGGIGESNAVTARTDIIDLAAVKPAFTPGVDLPSPLRYLNLTVTPWDEVFAAGGSRDYRGKENSYSNKAFSFDATGTKITPLADELVARSYHSGSLLLPDGRILIFGNDPLFSDKDNTISGVFEQRIELFTPPQLYTGSRPALSNAAESQQVARGQQLHFSDSSAGSIVTARLIPPSTVTHVTNIQQRSIGIVVHTSGNDIAVDIPSDENLLPNGWYMLFVVDKDGAPSTARMIQVVR